MCFYQKIPKPTMDEFLLRFDPKHLSPDMVKAAKKFQLENKEITTKCYMDDVLAVLFA